MDHGFAGIHPPPHNMHLIPYLEQSLQEGYGWLLKTKQPKLNQL